MHHPPPPSSVWPGRLLRTGREQLHRLAGAVDAADPRSTVSPRSRLLCAGLAELARVTHAAVGGDPGRALAMRAASLLSLLTKLDDQVIDGPAFHGGHRTDRGTLRRRTRTYLAPTLASIRTAAPATDESRCALAAELGQTLRAPGVLPDRRAHLLEVIARGWEIQVDAVAILTAHPATADPDEVARVTREISGAWLLMIALCGSLPEDAGRGLTPAEERAFFDLGGPIQRADALADLDKDAAEGLIATVPGLHCWRAGGAAHLDAVSRRDIPALFRAVAACDADRACLPRAGELEQALAALGPLGELPALLAWIHGFLLARYMDHPLCARERAEAPFATWAGPADAFAALYRTEPGEGAPGAAERAAREATCSGR